jgi:LppP/LprE lipoprotein
MANNAAMEHRPAAAETRPLRRRGRLRPLLVPPRQLTGALAGALTVAALASGCGSGNTETVSVSGAQAPPQHGARAESPRRQSTGKAPAPGTAPRPGSPSSSTRSGTGPAFTQQDSGEGLQGALATIRAHGYTAEDPSEYHASQTLRVLVGTRAGSSDGHGQQAFFFIDGRYIGTDTSAPSANVRILAQGDTEVTLSYPLYRPHDALCCPGGGDAKVRFQLNDGRLAPLDPIPPASSQSGLSRQ